jgi:hypothetical protein
MSVLVGKKVLAKGGEVWKLLDKYKVTAWPYVVAGPMGQPLVLYPFDRFVDSVYVTNTGDGGIFLQGDTLVWVARDAVRDEFFLNKMVMAGLKAAWVVPVYKAMVRFALTYVGGLVPVRTGVSAASFACFWSKHAPEVLQCLANLKGVVQGLQYIYSHCPKLGLAMLAVALQQGQGEITAEVRKKGVARFVIDNLDLDKYVEDLAGFLGALVKFAVKGVESVAAELLLELGLKRLAKLTVALAVVGEVKSLVRQAGRLATGPELMKQQLAAKFVTMFAQAGVRLNTLAAAGIAQEVCVADPRRHQVLEALAKDAERLEQGTTRLVQAAQFDLF